MAPKKKSAKKAPAKKTAPKKKLPLANEWKEPPSANPEQDDLELREDLAQEHGQPCFFSGNGERINKVNELYYGALFAAKQAGFLFEVEEERPYFFNPVNGLWEVFTPEQVTVKIQKFMLEESKRPGFEQLEAKRTIGQAKTTYEYLRGLRGKRGVFSFKPESRKRVLHLLNGVIEINDGVMGDFKAGFHPAHYSRNQIPVNYDPAAKCPRFLNDLLWPALAEETRKEDTRLLSMLFGLYILGVNLPQKIVILDGEAGSGKSTISKIAGLIIGERNRAMLRTDHLGGRFELAGYIGKTLLMGADVDPKFLLKPAAGILKSLTGGDMLQAESKHGTEFIPLRGCFNTMIVSNSALRVKIENDRGAWRRRLVIVRFQEHVPTQRIESFENVLFREEGPGIVNWALEGLRLALDSIYNGNGTLPMTAAQMQRVEDLLSQSEALESYVNEHIEAADGCSLPKRRIREEFGDYCREQGWEIPAKNEVGRRLPMILKRLFGVGESNSVNDNGKQVQGYHGVAFKEITD